MDSKVKKHETKKRFFLIIIPISLVVMITSIQCVKENKENKCEAVLCTDIYMSISLKLKYPNGQPVLLDDSKVFWIGENRYLEQNPVSWNEARVWGSYAIIDDRMRKELHNRKEVMRFTGYLDGKIVCERDVLVGADCCHVNYFGIESLTHVIHD